MRLARVRVPLIALELASQTGSGQRPAIVGEAPELVRSVVQPDLGRGARLPLTREVHDCTDSVRQFVEVIDGLGNLEADWPHVDHLPDWIDMCDDSRDRSLCFGRRGFRNPADVNPPSRRITMASRR